MVDRLKQHLNESKLLPPRSKLVVAVSGGVDSVSLLDMLANLQPYFGWDMTVAHLDHNIRGDSSEDALLVSRLAQQYGYQFFLNQLTDPGTSEAALRRARYDFLESVRAGLGADYIVTAHHADDKIETSILNAIRGADRYGLTALKPLNGYVARPLLPFSKGQLITYAALHDLPYHTDSTNSDLAYSRNFVRNNLLSEVGMAQPNWRADQIENLGKLEELSAQIDWQLGQVLDDITRARDETSITLDRSALLSLPPRVMNNVLVYAARQLKGGLGLSESNIARAEEFARDSATGMFSNALPHLIIERNYDSLVLAQSDSFSTQSLPTQMLQPNRPLSVGDFQLSLSPNPTPTNQTNYLVKPSKLYVRGWQAGDRIAPIGMTGHRKLQDIFIDKKVPRRDRANWPVVVDGQNQPVWVVGLGFDRNALAGPDEPHYQLTAIKH